MRDLLELMALFDSVFYPDFNTRLVRGGEEPVYLPADDACAFHRIVFARDYFSSALHEIAHWCIAGAKRRQLLDYGYWYRPDGRSEQQQTTFEQVEIKPQALEWAFHAASGRPFNVSCDNLSGQFAPDHRDFRRKVRQQTLHYLEASFPARAQRFIQALCTHYRQPALTGTSFT